MDMKQKKGYEIDIQGNIGNETRRIEDLPLRFVILVTCILTRDPTKSGQELVEQAVKTCHKETGIPISELASLLVRMTKEIKEITVELQKNSKN